MADHFRPPKQWSLTENETITSFANWQSNMLYHLSLCNDFSSFLEGDWLPQSVQNRGLTDDPVGADNRKTAVQKKIMLERMLGLIAQFAPSLLRNEIIKRSTSLSWIWQRIRKHFNFVQSEVNFLSLSNIARKPDERYETFYQRIVAHLEDNLLTVASGLHHDGALPTTDETMSPTTERLAVYLWLQLVDSRLSAYVARVYAHDLQTQTLKDIQSRLSQSMDSLLAELSAQEEIQIQYTKSKYQYSSGSRAHNNKLPLRKQSSSRPSKTCSLCKAANRSYTGHSINDCWFLSKFEKMEIAKALQVTVAYESDRDDENEPSDINLFESSMSVTNEPTIDSLETKVQKVECDTTSFFFAFYRHHPCHIVIDTGATSSVVSQAFVKRSEIDIKKTAHSARSADKSNLPVLGEVHFTLNFGNLDLPITALVIEKLDCDILAGIPFCKTNDIHVHLKAETISIGTSTIPYGNRGSETSNNQRQIRRIATLIRNDSEKIVMPGEYVEFTPRTLHELDCEVAIEPHTPSSSQTDWIHPSISRVINGVVRIPNMTDEPIQIAKSQHLAHIHPVIVPDETSIQPDNNLPTPPTQTQAAFIETISVDPDGLLSAQQRQQFRDINARYRSVYQPNFGAYNDRSGPIRANISLGPVEPPSQKGKLPFYNQGNLQLLQEEADKLERLGVLAKPEDVGVDVKFVSPSFLRKKPDGSYRFVTAFNNLGQYVRITPTATMKSDDVLNRLSNYKYIIKTDFTKSFFQIPVTKKSMPYLATVTPFKGLRVYLRSAMGMPGSSEFLNELTSRVFGDYITEGFLTVIHDDLFIGANIIPDLIRDYERVQFLDD